MVRGKFAVRAVVCLAIYSTAPGVVVFPGFAQELSAPKLSITIIEGDGAINNIKSRVARETIVEVDDENHKPVAGAIVTFTLPDSGPGATFANGSHFLTVTTDSNGRAAARGLRPNKKSGQYAIRVLAALAGATATAIITQRNAGGAEGGAVGRGGLFGIGVPATIAVIVVLVAGTVIGIVAATGGNSRTARVSVGTPTLP